jgi:CHAD domain-containing protein
MPQFDKLLTDVGPNDPPARAARRALQVRLRAVLYCLKRAAVDSADRMEEIHQLRVWTRRSTAALKLFQPLLPGKKSRRLKKSLRKLRQTAGAARDLDIIGAQLGQAVHGPLAERLSQQRKTAHRDLARLLRRWKKKGRLKRMIKPLLRRIDRRTAQHEHNGAAFAPWCRRQLVPLVEEFTSRASGGARQGDAALHQWRLAAKRLKYALELAIAALPQRTWTPFYALLGELQDRLGRVCDALVERQRLGQWRNDTDDALERKVLAKLESDCRRRLSAAKKQLAQWWTSSRGQSAERHSRKVARAESAKPWQSR